MKLPDLSKFNYIQGLGLCSFFFSPHSNDAQVFFLFCSMRWRYACSYVNTLNTLNIRHEQKKWDKNTKTQKVYNSLVFCYIGT